MGTSVTHIFKIRILCTQKTDTGRVQVQVSQGSVVTSRLGCTTQWNPVSEQNNNILIINNLSLMIKNIWFLGNTEDIIMGFLNNKTMLFIIIDFQ